MKTLSAKAPRQVSAVAMEAFVFTYPLVLLELTRRQLTSTRVAGELLAPMNQFAHMRKLPAPPFPLVTPNPDTLYSSAWLDLSAGPLMLSIPDIFDRYFAIPMYDAWTGVIASLGTRTSGGEATDIVIRGPCPATSPASDLTVIDSPTNIVWIIGRVQVDGPEDYEAVHKLQQGFCLTPLEPSTHRAADRTSSPASSPTRHVSPPVSVLARMDPETYFRTVTQLIKLNPPRPEDAHMVTRMRAAGLLRMRPQSPTIDPGISRAIARGMSAGLAQIEAAGRNPTVTTRNNWIFRRYPNPDSRDYLSRASSAWTGLGALPPAEGLTSWAEQDAQGHQLSGAHHYVLHFRTGAMPPVHAFWSLAVQDAQPFLVSDEPRHDAIGGRSGLHYETDGSVLIHIRHDPPTGAETVMNWLRTPRGPFILALRLFWPQDQALTCSWWPPPVTCVP